MRTHGCSLAVSPVKSVACQAALCEVCGACEVKDSGGEGKHFSSSTTAQIAMPIPLGTLLGSLCIYWLLSLFYSVCAGALTSSSLADPGLALAD